jgi:hypothetical protein
MTGDKGIANTAAPASELQLWNGNATTMQPLLLPIPAAPSPAEERNRGNRCGALHPIIFVLSEMEPAAVEGGSRPIETQTNPLSNPKLTGLSDIDTTLFQDQTLVRLWSGNAR